MGIRILVADDEPDIVLGLSDRLKWLGHEVTSACDGQAALTVLESQPVDLVFLDLEMPRLSGIEALRRTRQRWPDLPVIILTAHGTIPLAVEAMKDGAVVCNSGHFNVEIDIPALEAMARLRAAGVTSWRPQVIHANDWQTGLVPVYLRTLYRDHPHLGTIVRRRRVVSQYQEDLPVQRPVVHEFHIAVGHCRQCHRRVQGRHPLQTSDALGAAAVQLGPQAVALAVILNKQLGLSFGKIVQLFRGRFGLTVTRGGVVQAGLEDRAGPAVDSVACSKPFAI